jgi:hypothetical protein
MRSSWSAVCARSTEFDLGRLNEDVVELSLLLPGWQFGALEKAARDKGLSTGQMVRQLIQKFLLERC